MDGNVKQDPLFYPVHRLRVNSHTIAAKIKSPFQVHLVYLCRVYPTVDLKFSGDYNGGLSVCVDLSCVLIFSVSGVRPIDCGGSCRVGGQIRGLPVELRR